MLGQFLLMTLATINLFFATDMDKTLVHYTNSTIDTTVVALPASSTGKIGYVALETLTRLNNIAELLPHRLMCVSGQRPSTMLQRQATFPMITYWICENGGRLFTRAVENPSLLIEDRTFAERLFANSSASGITFNQALDDLRSLNKKLLSLGFAVDSSGYERMIRVKLTDGELLISRLNELISSFPRSLEHTFNLGYLDIVLRGVNKHSAIELVLKEQNSCVQNDYFFMGDDDNDILAASHAFESFIVYPCSNAMSRWMDYVITQNSETLSIDVSENPRIKTIELERQRPLRLSVPHLGVSDHSATLALLDSVLLRIRRSSGGG